MKIRVGLAKVEGFTTHVLLKLEDGPAILQSQKLVWHTRDQKQAIVAQIKDFIQQLQAAGFEVEGTEHPNDI
jgi:hypothetical protein